MLAIVCTGTLISDPHTRTGSNGRPYALVTLRVPTEDETILVSAIAFNGTAQRTILACTKGDTLSLTGRAKINAWEKDGAEHHGLSMVCGVAMSVYQLGERRKRSAAPADQADGSALQPRRDSAAKAVNSSQESPPDRPHVTPDTSTGVADLEDDLAF